MNRYKAYKDSGVKWIGEIPSHWKTTKLKHIIVKLYREKRPNSELLVCSNKGEVIKKGDSKIGLIADNDDIYQGVCKGDLLIHGMDTWHGAIAISNFDGMCTPVVHVCDSKQNKTYITLYLQFMAISKVFKLISNGVRQNTSDFRSWDKVGAIPIMVPPLHEQQAIVDYLKDKTLKIEQYVSARERERELLDSLKQSEVANVVTKGLNPNVKMKDSGIPWIGKIPEHWEVKRWGNVFKENKDINSNLENTTAFQFNYGSLVRKKREYKEEEDAETYAKYTILKPKDIVINGLNLNYDFVSQRVAISDNNGIITSAYISMHPRDNVEAQYFCYLFKTMDAMKLFHGMGTGIRLTLSFAELKKQYIPIPPLSEQQAIVAYIDEKLQKIDKYMADLLREIDYLKEFKQRLISDAVTGQLCVTKQ